MGLYETWISMYTKEMEAIDTQPHLLPLQLILFAFDQQVKVTRDSLQEEFVKVKEDTDSARKRSALKRQRTPVRNDKVHCVLPKIELLRTQSHDSPDIFQPSPLPVVASCTSPVLTDADTIDSTPEKCKSPTIKRKRHSRRNRMSKMSKISINLNDNITECNENENIKEELKTEAEATPDFISNFLKPLKKQKSNSKKKLFERPLQPQSQNRTLTQMYQQIESTQVNKNELKEPEMHESSMISVEDMLASVAECAEVQSQDTVLESKTQNEMARKRQCRICVLQGAACNKHRVPLQLKERDQTFNGFWNLDFTAKSNRTTQAADNSSLFM